MGLSLKIIGEVQYGLGIAFILLVVIGNFIITPYQQEEYYHMKQVDFNDLNKELAANGFTPKEQVEMDLMIGIGYDTQVGNWNTFKYTFAAISLGFIVLGFFMILQGIANIKMHRHTAKESITFKKEKKRKKA